MNKTQKDYVIQRINLIKGNKLIQCSCKAPDLLQHIRRACVEGTAKLKPNKDVQAIVASASLGNGYHNQHVDAMIFCEPESYKKEIAARKAEEAKIQKKNDLLIARYQHIIDAVNLDRYKNGETAIADAMKI